MDTPTDTEILETLAAAVESGRRIWVRPAGVSMGPAFHKADAVAVESARVFRLQPGRIVVYQRSNRWVAHRIVWVFGSRSPYRCITKGDGLPHLDRPFVSRQEWIGMVTAVRHGTRIRNLNGLVERIRGIFRIVAGLAWIPINNLRQRQARQPD
jgi:signal peptidase I